MNGVNKKIAKNRRHKQLLGQVIRRTVAGRRSGDVAERMQHSTTAISLRDSDCRRSLLVEAKVEIFK